jgi:predicted nuclease of predicted toxin-antitoxin system
MIIADENIPVQIIDRLRLVPIDVYSIFESFRGAKDYEIIELSSELPKIILTEDKDFGDLVFAYNHKKVSVILLRYHFSEMENVINILIDFLNNNKVEEFSFIVITTKNIRIRRF